MVSVWQQCTLMLFKWRLGIASRTDANIISFYNLYV